MYEESVHVIVWTCSVNMHFSCCRCKELAVWAEVMLKSDLRQKMYQPWALIQNEELSFHVLAVIGWLCDLNVLLPKCIENFISGRWADWETRLTQLEDWYRLWVCDCTLRLLRMNIYPTRACNEVWCSFLVDWTALASLISIIDWELLVSVVFIVWKIVSCCTCLFECWSHFILCLLRTRCTSLSSNIFLTIVNSIFVTVFTYFKYLLVWFYLFLFL